MKTSEEWERLLLENWDVAADAITAAYRKAIECGVIDACEGQAFQAKNDVLLNEDGTVETLRYPPGILLGEVKEGKALVLASYIDWDEDSFRLDENEPPEDIDIDELMFGFNPWAELDHVIKELEGMHR